MVAKREMWKDLDYWVWCLMTGDDEQTRLWEAPTSVIKNFVSAGATRSEATEAKNLISLLKKRGLTFEIYQKNYDKLEKLLLKHVSHKQLLKEAEGVWYDAYCKKLFR